MVQVTNEDGGFCGWADGRGKYDIVGTWAIDEKWSPEQAAELGRAVSGLKGCGLGVKVTERGISRAITSWV